MHAAAFEVMGLEHTYVRRRVEGRALESVLGHLRADGYRGVNVTVPHKVAACSLVDAVEPLAARIGAVNTIDVRPDGQLSGRNTDAPGFVRGLRASELEPRRCVILGGGGAARGIVHGLLEQTRAEIAWVSREPGRLSLDDDRVSPIGWHEVGGRLDADLWVNATTVGMPGGPQNFPQALPLERLTGDVTVVDIVVPTPSGGLLARARSLGHRTMDWRPMLLWQGVLALEGWLEERIPDRAINAMRASLGG
jgi:shikimate dehydrogenase